ncbi:T3SS effector HopA1 family protein [Nonomuraea sp. NPDC048901]|uniref:T3SS effector HopA1 family protein n=1 Tax=Nonomuraea sp. NPDC048901 TaxID=3155627 RepID=UPI0034007EBF
MPKNTLKKKKKKNKRSTTPGVSGASHGVVKSVSKTKRGAGSSVVSQPARPASAPARRPSDAVINRNFLAKAYREYYNSAGRRRPTSRTKRVYSFMGDGPPGYLNTPIGNSEFQNLLNGQTQGDYKVEAQSASDNWRGLRAGDYFHLTNEAHPLPSAQKAQTLANRARRLIVNVKNQAAALKAVRGLVPLFKDGNVGPFFRSFKVFLSSKADTQKSVKYDKLVVYYALKDPNAADDDVGKQLVSAIETAVPEGDRDSAFAPFYSFLTPGVAWAEEPKYYVQKLDNSFTETRANVIDDVIKNNDAVPNEAAFATLVDNAFRSERIDPVKPHRHVKTP